jgi:hypothetical protein
MNTVIMSSLYTRKNCLDNLSNSQVFKKDLDVTYEC